MLEEADMYAGGAAACEGDGVSASLRAARQPQHAVVHPRARAAAVCARPRAAAALGAGRAAGLGPDS
eukprot:4773358-Alexandrium_andersonii.AAC.1